jgi:hypothetical protein
MVATQRTLLATILRKLSGIADDVPLRVRFYKGAKCAAFGRSTKEQSTKYERGGINLKLKTDNGEEAIRRQRSAVSCRRGDILQDIHDEHDIGRGRGDFNHEIHEEHERGTTSSWEQV